MLNPQVPEHSNVEKHSYVTIVGLRGSTVGIVPAYGEGPAVYKSALRSAVPREALSSVQFVSSDTCSGKMHNSLKEVLPNLRGVCLDPMHICFTVDKAMKKNGVKPKIAGLVLRAIMGKFDVRHSQLANEDMYCGGWLPPMSSLERTFEAHIRHGSMPQDRAFDVLTSMNPNNVCKTLSNFLKLLAAYVSMFPEKMGSANQKGSLRRSILNAASPANFQWYLNNAKCRSSLPVEADRAKGVGTTRNEALHARLNAHFRQVTVSAAKTLSVTLRAWLAADMSISVTLLQKGLPKKMTPASVRPYVCEGIALFDVDGWRRLLHSPRVEWKPAHPAMKKKIRKLRVGYAPKQGALLKSIRSKLIKRRRSGLQS